MDDLIRQNSFSNALAIYQILANQGLNYAKLAIGIADNSTLTGFITNKYLQLIAKWKFQIIISNQTNADIVLNDIKIAMAYEYARYIIKRYDQQRVTSLELINISFIKIRELHTKVFSEFGLSSEVWILFIPFRVFDRLHNIKQVYFTKKPLS